MKDFAMASRHLAHQLKRDIDLSQQAIQQGQLDHALLFAEGAQKIVGQLQGIILAEAENRRDITQAALLDGVLSTVNQRIAA